MAIDWGAGIGHVLGSIAQAQQRRQDLALQRGMQQMQMLQSMYGPQWAQQNPEAFRSLAAGIEAASRQPRGFWSNQFGDPTMRFPREMGPGAVLQPARAAQVLPSGLARAEGVPRVTTPAQPEVRGPGEERIRVPGQWLSPDVVLSGLTFKPGRETFARSTVTAMLNAGETDVMKLRAAVKDDIEPSKSTQTMTTEFNTRVDAAQKHIDQFDAAIRAAAVNNPDAVAGLVQQRDAYVERANRALTEHAGALNTQGVATKFQGLTVAQVDQTALTRRGRQRAELTEQQLALTKQRLAALESRGGLTADDKQIIAIWRSGQWFTLGPEQRAGVLAKMDAVLRKLGVVVPPKPADPAKQRAWWQHIEGIFHAVFGGAAQAPSGPTSGPPKPPPEQPADESPPDDLSDLGIPP